MTPETERRCAARLHTHLVLTALGLTQGLWSPLRGMARAQDGYYARLNNADLQKRNDLDGRGPLSQEELVAFASWLLDLCLDQATFMRSLVSLESLKLRMHELLLSLSARPSELILPPGRVAHVHAADLSFYLTLPVQETEWSSSGVTYVKRAS